MDKVIPTGADNCLEEIDRHLIEHTDEFTMRDKHYKDDDQWGYVINVGSFNIKEELEWPRIIEDGNDYLQTMYVITCLNEKDSYVYIEIKDGNIPAIDETEVSTFTTEPLPLADEKLFDIISKNQDTIPPEVLEYLKKTRIRSKGRRRQKWIHRWGRATYLSSEWFVKMWNLKRYRIYIITIY